MKNADKGIFSGTDGETMMKCLEATFVDQHKDIGIFLQCLKCKQFSTWKYRISMRDLLYINETKQIGL